MGVPLNEQETCISWFRDGRSAVVYTTDSTTMTKLDKMCESSKNYELEKVQKNRYGEILAKKYRVRDKSLISFRSAKTQRVLTDEERAAVAERFRSVRN